VRIELKVGDIIRYDSNDPERSCYMVCLGDGFYFREGKVFRNRKKLHKIAVELAKGKGGRFHRFKRL